MKKSVFIVICMSCGMLLQAQDFVDNALLFSRTRAGGSARIQALGGAQVALGGDYSVALSNPAGLGFYNRSEFTITPAVYAPSVKSTYRGQTTDDARTVFNLPGISLVLNRPSGKQSGFIGGSFAFTMSRVNDFNMNYRYRSSNDEHSIIDYFIADAYGIDPATMLRSNGNAGSNFFNLTALAYNNYLIEDYVDNSNNFAYRSVLSPLPEEPGFPAEVRTIDQEEINESRGAQTQWSISYGANFNDRIFIGAGIGIASIKYKITQIFRESDFRYSEDPDFRPIDSFQAQEDYDIRGSGINVTLGAIYRPVNFLQFGASFATPTIYNITDTYDARVESIWNYYNDASNPSYPGQSDVYESFDEPLIGEYTFTSPLRVRTGATLLSKIGFLTAEVEFVDYSKARYRSTIQGENFDSENGGIKGAYGPAINYRMGAEYRHEMFRVRAGYDLMQDPYKNVAADRSIQSVSAGVGIRKKDFFADFATVFSKSSRQRSPYPVQGPDPLASQEFRSLNYLLTVGFTF